MLPLAHYEKRYKISREGKVLNLANNTWLTPTMNPNGYLKIGLANGDGTSLQTSIHRLVAKHFLPNPYEHTQVNHKDGDKTNNCAENLEWCSATENAHHAFKTKLRPGYMSADDKEKYLHEVLNGVSVSDLAFRIGRRAETLHKMLRDTAKRLNVHAQWVDVMRKNRKQAALRNLEKINANHSS